MHLLPRNPKFFQLFVKLSSIAEKEADVLYESLNEKSPKSVAFAAKRAKELEHEADKICHLIIKESDSTFITPIDREDIQILTQSLDNVVDHIENLLSNTQLYGIKRFSSEYKLFIPLIERAVDEVDAIVRLLEKKSKGIAAIKKKIVRIHTIENEGDELLRVAIKSLFSNHKNLVEIIKWKDLYENTEQVLDGCEDVADIVDAIVTKNF